MADSARALAADIINDVVLHGRSLTATLEAVRPGLDPRLMATAQDLSYGVLRHYGRLRYFLRRLAGRPIQPPEVTGILLVALFELADRATPTYAAVNEAVTLAGRRFPHSKGFVNGVLRNFLRRRAALALAADAEPEARWNFPSWWTARLRQQYPENWEAMLTSMNGHPPMTLRVNRRRTTLADYAASLDAAGIGYRITGEWALTLSQPVRRAALPGFLTGQVSVQDLGAQYAAGLLDAVDGMRTLDACAAPGGKTAHLLEAHTLDLLALDLDAGRLDQVAANLGRLGLAATLRAADAARPQTWWDDRPFDRILLDAPCTASGVVRRHPDGKWLKRSEDVHTLAKQQSRLLDAVWPRLAQGGKLLYATCSLFSEENQDQVEAFLRRHPDARLEKCRPPGARDGQLLPNVDHDGFFYARFFKA